MYRKGQVSGYNRISRKGKIPSWNKKYKKERTGLKTGRKTEKAHVRSWDENPPKR